MAAPLTGSGLAAALEDLLLWTRRVTTELVKDPRLVAIDPNYLAELGCPFYVAFLTPTQRPLEVLEMVIVFCARETLETVD